MADTDETARAEKDPHEPKAPTQVPREAGELTDEQLDKVSGGQASQVLQVRHDTAKNAIANIR